MMTIPMHPLTWHRASPGALTVFRAPLRADDFFEVAWSGARWNLYLCNGKRNARVLLRSYGSLESAQRLAQQHIHSARFVSEKQARPPR